MLTKLKRIIWTQWWLKRDSQWIGERKLSNESPTNEFTLGMDLRLGYNLSSFLFLIILEGVSVLLKPSIEVGSYKDYFIGEELGNHVRVSHL